MQEQRDGSERAKGVPSRMQVGSSSPYAAAWEGCIYRENKDAEISGKGP